jgi:hypothetical protein
VWVTRPGGFVDLLRFALSREIAAITIGRNGWSGDAEFLLFFRLPLRPCCLCSGALPCLRCFAPGLCPGFLTSLFEFGLMPHFFTSVLLLRRSALVRPAADDAEQGP